MAGWNSFEAESPLPVKFLASDSLPFLVSPVILFSASLTGKKKGGGNYTKDRPGLCHTVNTRSGLRTKDLTWDQRDFLQCLETRTSSWLILQVQI